jgi:anaerobic dimethyl sulfoxide reductase subunit C (anchor subunit)
VGASSLSNEIASGALFFAVGGIGWLLAVVKKLPAGLRQPLAGRDHGAGVIFVWMMVRVYNTIDTVPTWYTVWTPLSFFLTMFIGGPLLGYLLLRVAGVDGWAMRLLPVVTLLALVERHRGADARQRAGDNPQLYSAGLCAGAGLRLADGLAPGCAGAGAGCWIVPQLKGYQPACRCWGWLLCWCWSVR